ncbi:DUF4136 domain-containing protein [Aurantiacibacter gangjinensis]|uniref:Uncharacterized protein n=1 Tax=Aurantiacibacter gangjinensis TaxID=502682 RepID=A0A0G9MPG5_9SPHN|nr:DUF4136 domain-containing protein [Aurantiacibacter gangjinensis]APE29457.1 hypothetical protein BMF35_b0202 [Aurantiacibacter gangjinensis]KLE31163.1 hypothetical protein AAW01_13135 [Aurantiacibacter gangjinensis]
MKKLLAALAPAVLVAGCATPAYVSPVDVTRFVTDEPTFLAQGTIQIVPAPGIEGESIEYGIYREAVRLELEELGYRVVAVNGEQVAQVDLDQYIVDEDGARRSPVGVGVGGSTGTFGSGVGVGVGINLNSLFDGGPRETIQREIAVSIRAAEGGTNLWEGRASMAATANSDFASDAAAAPRMAEALFSGFPGVSGETIAVE